METIKVMVNGVPGNVAVNVAKHIINDDRFELILHSLTGPEITQKTHTLDDITVNLIKPNVRSEVIKGIIEKNKPFISVDYTHPLAVNENTKFYCEHDLPFVMGTTGGDGKLLGDTVKASMIPAVIAPNMAKQIVGFQAMLQWCAENFPDIFKGYTLEIKESHQKHKADTSGTAKVVAKYFKKMGVLFSEKDIIKERNPEVQKKKWGVPEKYINGHGYHTYTLVSDDRTVKFLFSHFVNGRDVYARGTLDAIMFLYKKHKEGVKGEVFTMIDVLKGV